MSSATCTRSKSRTTPRRRDSCALKQDANALVQNLQELKKIKRQKELARKRGDVPSPQLAECRAATCSIHDAEALARGVH